MIHEAKLHTNREIMVREQEMLLEDLAAFIIQLSAATHGPAGSPGSSTNSPEWLQMISSTAGIPQQQQQQGLQLAGLAMQHHQRQQSMDAQQDMLQLLHQQQQQQQPGGVAGEGGSGGGGGNARVSAQVSSLTQVIRGWTVQNMVDQVFPVRQEETEAGGDRGVKDPLCGMIGNGVCVCARACVCMCFVKSVLGRGGVCCVHCVYCTPWRVV